MKNEKNTTANLKQYVDRRRVYDFKNEVAT